MISIANKYNAEKKFRWINYNEYKIVVKKIIKNNEISMNDEDLDKFIENNFSELTFWLSLVQGPLHLNKEM